MMVPLLQYNGWCWYDSMLVCSSQYSSTELNTGGMHWESMPVLDTVHTISKLIHYYSSNQRFEKKYSINYTPTTSTNVHNLRLKSSTLWNVLQQLFPHYQQQQESFRSSRKNDRHCDNDGGDDDMVNDEVFTSGCLNNDDTNNADNSNSKMNVENDDIVTIHDKQHSQRRQQLQQQDLRKKQQQHKRQSTIDPDDVEVLYNNLGLLLDQQDNDVINNNSNDQKNNNASYRQYSVEPIQNCSTTSLLNRILHNRVPLHPPEQIIVAVY
jgi:hypothetical protein